MYYVSNPSLTKYVHELVSFVSEVGTKRLTVSLLIIILLSPHCVRYRS